MSITSAIEGGIIPAMSAYRGSSKVVSEQLRRVLFGFVWLMFFLNGFVFREPAPCDLLMIGFIVIMPLFGMIRFTPLHSLLLAGWALIIACGLMAAGGTEIWFISIKHMLISLYLAVFSVALAGFVTRDPGRHLPLIWNGYMCGAIVAALAGIIGYFDLIPGSFELFTKYSRASGTFKDPNVFGPYLVPAFLYCLHILLTKRATLGILALVLMGLFLFGILMCFSRGAWMLFAVSSACYVALFFFTAPSQKQRLKIIALCLGSLIALAGVISVALQSPKVQELWKERVTLNQGYDVGDQGRFSGHVKAGQLILENPIGIGALYFGYFHHHELPHNLYLSMYLSTGWIGGTVFLILILTTLVLGITTAFKRTTWMHYHAIAVCTFVGLVLESYIIDSDHWRLLYILIGLIWGGYGALKLEELQSQKINTLHSEPIGRRLF